MAKLTEKKVAKIKELIVEGKMTQQDIARKYGVKRSTISAIDTETTWKTVPWPGDYKPKAQNGQRGRAMKTEYDPTDIRIIELESEVQSLRQERTHARKLANASKTERGIYRAVVDEMEKRVTPLTIDYKKRPTGVGKVGKINEALVLHLSDGHHDQNVRPDECGGLESHDFPTAVRRGERYVDIAIDYALNTLKSYNFEELWLLAYGDHTSGEIHGSVQRSYFRNQFKNSFAIGQLHAAMIAELAPYFPKVNVLYLPGNHGRRSIKKDFHGAHDNWDYAVAKTAEFHLKNADNVSFVIPDAFSANIAIRDVGFHVFHGDDVMSHQGVPWYGLEKRTRKVAAISHITGLPRVRYAVCGHFHKPGTIGDMDGEMIINGPWVATDAYAYNRFAGYTRPTQLMHGVNSNHGITWRLGIHPRNEKSFKERPTRFHIPALDDVGLDL